MAETHFDSSNIIVGIAALYIAPVGTAAPAMPAMGTAAPVVAAPWVPFGYTDAGIKFSYGLATKEVRVDEEMAPVDDLPDTETVKVSLSIAELTMENLNRIIPGGTLTLTAPGAAQAGLSTLQIGSKATKPRYALLIVGGAPKGYQRMVNIYQSTATASTEFQYKRAEKLMTPVEFTGLALSSQAVGNRLMQIIDKTADATS